MKVVHNSELEESSANWPNHMQRAIDLACSVLTTTPNPRVGCVITLNDTVLAEGWHTAAGQAHAEAAALQNSQRDVTGGTAFVSLEPCNHQGKTGPCSDALIAAGVSRVVIAMSDPNPAVAGEGIKKLEAAGIEVFHLVDFQASARAINVGFLKRWEKGRPYVRMKMAMSLDGRTALANGESKWISGAASRADVQKLRAQSSAIITGVGTVLADDPKLTVRLEELGLSEAQLLSNAQNLQRQPLRVVLDSKLQTPAVASILSAEGAAVIYTGAAANIADYVHGDTVDIRALDSSDSGVNLISVLESLAADYECNEVLLEAGPTLCGAFLKQGLADELIVYIAPRIFGSDARPLLTLKGIESLADTFDFTIFEMQQIGDDIKVTLQPSTQTVS